MTWRMLMGRRNNGTFGMDISEPGWDVFSAPDDHLLFSTNWNFGALVHQSGFVLRGQTIFFPALSYVPMVLVSAMDGANRMVRYYVFTDFGLARWYQEPLVKVYSNAIDFTAWAGGGGWSNPQPFNFWARYIVLRFPGGV